MGKIKQISRNTMTKKVVVTGATGRTGSLVVKKLQSQSQEFEVLGFARSEEKIKQIFGSTDGFEIGDILNKNDLFRTFKGCQALVILTSAVPQMQPPIQEGEKPEFYFIENGNPEQVDWIGQKNQIDVAKEVGIEHIVLVGSMGVTDKNHFLNTIGNGNILIWKSKAEQYLMESGIDYTIIRAGGLLDQPDGCRELIVGINDTLLISPPNNIRPSIPRGDVANTVMEALKQPNARNKAFDIISKPEEDSQAVITRDWENLFAQITQT